MTLTRLSDIILPVAEADTTQQRKQLIDAWLSLVERCVRDAEVVGSNPVASTVYVPET